MSLHDDVLGMVLHLLQRPGKPIPLRLDEALRLLSKYRTNDLVEQLRSGGGGRVRSGPFAGMMVPHVAEGSEAPRLLGTYEQGLHPVLASLPERGYTKVLNVGCAEGYYAVGLARLLPDAEVEAYDLQEMARTLCAASAAANGVAGRVSVGERFSMGDFARFAGTRCLLVCDIEGGEVELLRPEEAPALMGIDIIVEVHDDLVDGCSDLIKTRFASSHTIHSIGFGERNVDDFPELAGWDNLDQLLSFWEWRLGGNAWLWLEARATAQRSRTSLTITRVGE